MTLPLFNPDDLPEPPTPAEVVHASSGGKPRLRVPQRDQVELRWASLDELLELDHPVRNVWAAVCGLNLTPWLEPIKAVEHHVGRDATDPRLLLALWVYATIKAIGSARELDRLCRESLPYQWLCGGVSLNYHTLSDFRSQGGEKWDALLTQIVASLMSLELVKLERVAQDGMRVRASAGASSFRRRERLEECLEEARQQVEALKGSVDEKEGRDGNERRRGQIEAQRRAARERLERLEEALRECAELQEQREASAKQSGRKVEEARASTTDPEARNMAFADGGKRPGYNVQFSTDTESGVIVGVEVTNAGTDGDELPPMLDQLKRRYKKVPGTSLVDGGFATKKTIEESAAQGSTVYAPLKNEKKQLEDGKDPYAAKRGDSDAVKEWRKRMGTEEGKAIYRIRGQVAEWVNARCRNHGLRFMPVRGRSRCLNVALLHAIVHNLLVGRKLRAALEAAAS